MFIQTPEDTSTKICMDFILKPGIQPNMEKSVPTKLRTFASKLFSFVRPNQLELTAFVGGPDSSFSMPTFIYAN